jgi:hypothetical protein
VIINVQPEPGDFSSWYPSDCVWLPIESEDTEPFCPDTHYRLNPGYYVDGSRVVRLYPVIPKPADENKQDRIGARAAAMARVGGAAITAKRADNYRGDVVQESNMGRGR